MREHLRIAYIVKTTWFQVYNRRFHLEQNVKMITGLILATLECYEKSHCRKRSIKLILTQLFFDFRYRVWEESRDEGFLRFWAKDMSERFDDQNFGLSAAQVWIQIKSITLCTLLLPPLLSASFFLFLCIQRKNPWRYSVSLLAENPSWRKDRRTEGRKEELSPCFSTV